MSRFMSTLGPPARSSSRQAQVEIVNRVFSPSEEVPARRVVEAYQSCTEHGRERLPSTAR